MYTHTCDGMSIIITTDRAQYGASDGERRAPVVRRTCVTHKNCETGRKSEGEKKYTADRVRVHEGKEGFDAPRIKLGSMATQKGHTLKHITLVLV